MAYPICAISLCSSSYVRNSKPTMYSSYTSCTSCSSSLSSCPKTLTFSISSRFSQMGSCQFGTWNGLRHVGISISAKPQKVGRKWKCKGKVVYASLFGVGAPEALVIGAVALLVFGPKGLAEVARNLGKTLRAFQPTIRELQDVSREFKSTLEREIGLDDDLNSMNTYGSSRANTSSQSFPNLDDSQAASVADQNGTPPSTAYTSEEYLKITEEQLKASAAFQQNAASSPPQSQGQPQDGTSSPPESQTQVESQPQATIQETSTAAPPVQKPESET